MSRLTRTSLMLAVFLLVDKGVAIVRQLLIARQFNISKELDVFNIANNVPDLLFALISGGALAMAFIPVLSEAITQKGRAESWNLFSRVANLAFTATALLAVVVGLLADPLVRSEFGVAPGFSEAQKEVVVNLMRLNLVATLIFSVSGLVASALQANQHFLLPALAPILYNLGQIFGALILAPAEGMVIGGLRLPAFGLGVYGLVYGVIFGAALHLLVQLPGLIRFKFRWIPQYGLGDAMVRKVLRVVGPRLLTMFMIQLIFIVRDNLASRLEGGSVSALTYGWMIMQVPETVIGTAIGIAILPTLAELWARGDLDGFGRTVERAIQVLLALTIPVGIILAIGLRPFVSLAFGWDAAATDLLMWASRAFLLGLTGQCLMEVAARSFYARQDAITPLITAAINLTLYVGLGLLLFRPLGAPGIGLTDSLAFTSQAVVLFVILARRKVIRLVGFASLWRGLAAGLAAGLATWLVFQLGGSFLPGAAAAAAGMAVGAVVMVPIVLPELRTLLRL
jgi:putative peptidoglycan lipid II flippase